VVAEIYKESKLAFSSMKGNRWIELSPRSTCAGDATGVLKTTRTQLEKQAGQNGHSIDTCLKYIQNHTFPHLEHRSTGP